MKSDHGILIDVILALIIFLTVVITWLSADGLWTQEMNRIPSITDKSYILNLDSMFDREFGIVSYKVKKKGKYPLYNSSLLISDDDHAECEYWPEYPLLCVILV